MPPRTATTSCGRFTLPGAAVAALAPLIPTQKTVLDQGKVIPCPMLDPASLYMRASLHVCRKSSFYLDRFG